MARTAKGMTHSDVVVLVLLGMAAAAGLIVYGRTIGGEGTVPTVAALRKTNAPRRLTESLPPDSTDIAYRWRWFEPYESANFSVTESCFVDWARSRGWRVHAIADGPSKLVSVREPSGWATAIVSDGYVALGPEPGDWGGSAVYDRQAGRAYYTRTPDSD